MTPRPPLANDNITIVKSFPYRGNAEEFSNTYCFDGGAPTDATHWKALADAIIAQEKTIFDAGVSIVRAIGHKANVRVADWTYDYAAHSAAVAGTFAPGSDPACPGDVAFWLRWPTTAKTSKGKPIYLRSYYHNAHTNGNTNPNRDQLAADQKTAAETYGAAWVTGFSDGTNTHKRQGPNGATGGTAIASTYLTTRTLERRGKRP